MLHHYLMSGENAFHGVSSAHVPVTLKHFQLLACLGRTPNFYLWHFIEVGAEFYLDEFDYLSKTDIAKSLSARQKVKVEALQSDLSSPSSDSRHGKKRPRRSAVTVQSYAVPDSDEDDLMDDSSYQEEKKKPVETNLQLWIKHLNQLLKAETRKYTEMKKRLEKESEGDVKVRIQKNDFVKSLTTNLRTLRKLESENRIKYHYEDTVDPLHSDDEDDEYTLRRTKRRKATHA